MVETLQIHWILTGLTLVPPYRGITTHQEVELLDTFGRQVRRWRPLGATKAETRQRLCAGHKLERRRMEVTYSAATFLDAWDLWDLFDLRHFPFTNHFCWCSGMGVPSEIRKARISRDFFCSNLWGGIWIPW